MLTKIRERAQSEKGFTLIELLVVILIIGILAAIAIPAFLGQREKAQDAGAKTQARNAATAMESIYTDDQTYLTGAVPALTAAKKVEPSLGTENVTVAITDVTANGYTITATNAATGHPFVLTKAIDNAANTVTVTRTCANTGDGGCPTDGTW